MDLFGEVKQGLDGENDEAAGGGQQGEDDDEHQLVFGLVLVLFVGLEAPAQELAYPVHR